MFPIQSVAVIRSNEPYAISQLCHWPIMDFTSDRTASDSTIWGIPSDRDKAENNFCEYEKTINKDIKALK